MKSLDKVYRISTLFCKRNNYMYRAVRTAI